MREEYPAKFEFALQQGVYIKISGEKGFVRSRSDSVNTDRMYEVVYKDGTGTSKTNWHYGSELNPI